MSCARSYAKVRGWDGWAYGFPRDWRLEPVPHCLPAPDLGIRVRLDQSSNARTAETFRDFQIATTSSPDTLGVEIPFMWLAGVIDVPILYSFETGLSGIPLETGKWWGIRYGHDAARSQSCWLLVAALSPLLATPASTASPLAVLAAALLWLQTNIILCRQPGIVVALMEQEILKGMLLCCCDWPSRTLSACGILWCLLIQGEIIYATPLPPFLARRHFSGEWGAGCIFWNPPCGRNLYAPPLFYTPPPLDGVFSGVGGLGVYKIWPPIWGLLCAGGALQVWGNPSYVDLGHPTLLLDPWTWAQDGKMDMGPRWEAVSLLAGCDEDRKPLCRASWK